MVRDTGFLSGRFRWPPARSKGGELALADVPPEGFVDCLRIVSIQSGCDVGKVIFKREQRLRLKRFGGFGS